MLVLIAMIVTNKSIAQDTTIDGKQYPKPVNFTSQQNQDNMMQQLGIKKLRPGPSSRGISPRTRTMVSPRRCPAAAEVASAAT